jgi:hypothetical protein
MNVKLIPPGSYHVISERNILIATIKVVRCVDDMPLVSDFPNLGGIVTSIRYDGRMYTATVGDTTLRLIADEMWSTWVRNHQSRLFVAP